MAHEPRRRPRNHAIRSAERQSADAYIDGLKMLGAARAVRSAGPAAARPQGTRRRTTSTRPSRGCASERAIDDARVAEAIARTETSDSPARQAARAAADRARRHRQERSARRAVDEVFGAIDGDALIEAALAKRLRGGRVTDDAEFQRLYRYLVGQGFESDQVMTALKRKKREIE